MINYCTKQKKEEKKEGDQEEKVQKPHTL